LDVRQTLILHHHPASQAGSVSRISVEASRRRDRLSLHFCLEGHLANLALPPLERPARGERLWEHSCFEAFVRTGEGPDYLELNFAPSGRWAAYDFSGPRAGMTEAALEPPRIEIWSDHLSLHLKAEVAGLPSDSPWRLGLSAVIEEASGHMSYWALAHPSAKPDFHHLGSFVLTLP
jgi:hypothetical protein